MFSCVVLAYTCHQTHVASSNHDVKSPPITCTSSVQTSPHSTSTSVPPAVILDQPDIFTNILNTFTSSGMFFEPIMQLHVCLKEDSIEH